MIEIRYEMYYTRRVEFRGLNRGNLARRYDENDPDKR